MFLVDVKIIARFLFVLDFCPPILDWRVELYCSMNNNVSSFVFLCVLYVYLSLWMLISVCGVFLSLFFDCFFWFFCFLHFLFFLLGGLSYESVIYKVFSG